MSNLSNVSEFVRWGDKVRKPVEEFIEIHPKAPEGLVDMPNAKVTFATLTEKYGQKALALIERAGGFAR